MDYKLELKIKAVTVANFGQYLPSLRVSSSTNGCLTVMSDKAHVRHFVQL